jgi:predicted DCC family thiol-disulfide oxidoreductase YuxK
MSEAIQHKTILLFDGYCNFCSNTVQFILKHEKNNALFFASLQSETGVELLNRYHIDPAKTDSLVLIENDRAYVKSSAALRVSKHLKGLYPALSAFMIVPPFIRNWVYDFIARNRYKWFGKSDSCMLPDASVKQRFLSL